MKRLLEALRRVGAHPLLEPSVALVLRGATVRESGRFVTREALRRRGIRRYRLRRGGLTALIRHGTPDVVTLGEVFHRPDYAFPEEVEERLRALRGELTALDLGANIGLFGLWLLGDGRSWSLTSFEPDPDNAAVLRRVVETNRLADRWEVVEAAAGAADGVAAFDPGRFALSRLGEAGTARVPVVDVLPRLERTTLVKLDIEGGEWPILLDARFRDLGPRLLVLEYHPHMAPAGVPPREAVETRLRACGYELNAIQHRSDGHGMLWAWRT